MKALLIFNSLYLLVGGAYFFTDLNYEFVIYIGVIVAIVGGVLLTLPYTKFPLWMVWLLSIWGLLHVLGGAVETQDGVLFAYKIYPFLDRGGDFYILKYDQVVHAYLYGLVAVMTHHIIRYRLAVVGSAITVSVIAVLVSVGISSLNEIMEFLIAISLERNGVGGYENAMLDLLFNLGGAITGLVLYRMINNKNHA